MERLVTQVKQNLINQGMGKVAINKDIKSKT